MNNQKLSNFQKLTSRNTYMNKLFEYDLNEYSKIHLNKVRDEKVKRQQKLISSASMKLLSFKNIDKENLIDKMINSKSSFDNQKQIDERRVLFNNKMKNLTRNSSTFYENRKKINDFYEMNDKFIKQKNNFINQEISKRNIEWKRPPNFLDLYLKKKTNQENGGSPQNICRKFQASFYNNSQFDHHKK